MLLSGARAVCTAGTGFAGVVALAIAELSTTEAFAARMIRLLVCGLFSCVAMMHVHNSDAWVQLCCSAGRVLRAQLPPDSQVCGGAGSCRVKHNRGLCRTRDPFAVPRLVFVRGYGACTHFRCVGAALLFSGARAAYTAATGFTGVWRRWQLIAELSTPETHARSVCCAAACFVAELHCVCAIPMRGCSFAVQRGACCVHSWHQIRRCGGAGN